VNYELAHLTSRGGRSKNEDRLAVVERHNAVLLVVADGLGGHAGGEIAAEIVTQTLSRAFTGVRQPVIARPSAFLALSILQAHNAIRHQAKKFEPAYQPRSTCVACLVQDGYAYWAHVGDSRLYHFRHGQVLSRTQDHTSVEEMRQEGVLDDQEALDHPSKSRLHKCVGSPRTPAIALGKETLLHQGDVILLCSDGLWEAWSSAELARFLKVGTIEESVDDMLRATERKMRDTSDNVSVIGLRWNEAVTRAVPLQGNQAVQIDPERLWQDGTKWSANAKLQQQYQDKMGALANEKPSDDTPLENQIDELEKFLRRFEPKR
jgi:serine/threonine protein phosphatase PrpC